MPFLIQQVRTMNFSEKVHTVSNLLTYLDAAAEALNRLQLQLRPRLGYRRGGYPMQTKDRDIRDPEALPD